MEITINILTSILEIIIALFCFNAFMIKRKVHPAVKSSVILIYIVLNVIRTKISLDANINLIVTLLMNISVSIILYKDKWYKKVFANIIYLLLFMISEVISQYLVSFIMNIAYASTIEENKYVVLIITDFIALMITLYFINIPMKKITDVPLRYWIAIILMPLFCLGVVLVLDLTISTYNSSFYNILSVFILSGLIYCNIMIFDFFENYSSRIKLSVAEHVIKNNHENYKILEANEADMRILYHDILKHMAVIKSIAAKSENEKVIEYAEQFEKTVGKVTSVVYTGNVTMDSILNIESRIANLYDIMYFVKPVILSEIKISDADITAILKNALDNAIEAQKDLEKRCITVYISVYEDIIKIKVENFSNEVKIIENYTSKENKLRHGHGLKSIKAAVQKYNGEMNTEFNDGIFTLSLSIQNKNM